MKTQSYGAPHFHTLAKSHGKGIRKKTCASGGEVEVVILKYD
jgi:hypothetical protein